LDTNLKDDAEGIKTEANKKDDDKKNEKKIDINFTATSWGTLLLILILTVLSVGIYEPIRNAVIGYAPLTDGAFYGDFIEQDMILIFSIGGVSIFLLAVLALAIPYVNQKQATIIQSYNNIYLELKLLIWFIFFMACFAVFTLVMTFGSGWQSHFFEQIIHEANWYFYAIGIPITFTLYLLIYLGICYIKHIFYSGLVNEIVERTLIGKFCIYVSNYIKRVLGQIIDAEVSTDHKKRLLTLIMINFVVLMLIALAGAGFGILLVIGYTIFLFNSSLEVLDKVRALNAASNQLAKGDFNVTLPEDMGMLSSFAKSLNNIKEGFKIAVEKEVKSQNMKTELISNVSHDLKTPLTSIITYVDLLKNEDLDRDTQREYIDILDKKSKRLKVLIEDLFEASKASSGNIELDMERLDVIALLRQTLGEMEEKINQSTLKMRVNLPEHKVVCSLDGARTYRVFENVISNILKYSMPNSRVYIDAEEDDKSISLIFKNISSYEMNFDPSEITERFTRGDKSRSTEGSGLGLAIAKSLVELQGGNLNINIDGDLFKLTVTFPKAL